MKKTKAFLMVALLAPIFIGQPVAAQSETPLPITQVLPQSLCDGSCSTLLNDGDYVVGCPCWNAYFCFAETSYVKRFEILVNWHEGVTAVPILDGEVQTHLNRALPDPSVVGAHWYTFTNLGQADCILVSGITSTQWGDPNFYEARAWSGAGSMDVFQGNYWMVNDRVSSTLGAEVVRNFIYAILAFALGTMGLAMIIRGLFGATGAHSYDAGSGLGNSASGLSHPSQEVGDVD